MSKSKKNNDDGKRGNFKPRAVGKFRDPATGQIIVVYAKRGETDEEAMNRVKTAHNAS